MEDVVSSCDPPSPEERKDYMYMCMFVAAQMENIQFHVCIRKRKKNMSLSCEFLPSHVHCTLHMYMWRIHSISVYKYIRSNAANAGALY